VCVCTWSARVMSDLNRALFAMGLSDSRDAPVEVVVAKAAPKALTKKQLAEKEAAEKLEKLKKKAAKMVAADAGAKADGKKKEKKAEKDKEDKAKKEKEASDAAAAAAAEPSSSSADAVAAAPANPKARKSGRGAISAEDRRLAMEAERQRAEEAEAAFASAYACTPSAAALETVPMDYTVRSAEELEAARCEAERAREAQVSAAAAKQLEAVVRAATAKKKCEVSFEEWGLLRLATAAAA